MKHGFSIKKLLFKLLRFSGLPFLLKIFIQKRRITVIYYHNIDPLNFEMQVKQLLRNYNIISIETLADYLYNKIETLPPWSLLITLDDGHAANYKLLNILKQYQIKPTIFLTASLIGTSRPFWFNLSFKTPHEKEQLKFLPNSERLEYLKKNYSEELDKPVKQSLSWNEVIEMSHYFDFHSHTLEHPCLPKCTYEAMSEEVVKSKLLIEDRLEKKVYAIAYPNGDFTQRELETVKNAEYLLGFTTIPGYVHKKTNPYAISRFSMNDTKDLNDFILRHTGAWFLLKKATYILLHPWKLLTD